MFCSTEANDYIQEHLISKHDDLLIRCDNLDSAVKLINDLNDFYYDLSESLSIIRDIIDSENYDSIEKMLDVIAWASTLLFPNFHEKDDDFNSPKDIIFMIYEEYYENQHVINILKQACDKYNVDMSNYEDFMK